MSLRNTNQHMLLSNLIQLYQTSNFINKLIAATQIREQSPIHFYRLLR